MTRAERRFEWKAHAAFPLIHSRLRWRFSQKDTLKVSFRNRKYCVSKQLQTIRKKLFGVGLCRGQLPI